MFESVGSRRTQRYYIGGIARYSNREGLNDFLEYYGIKPAAVKLIQTKRGPLSAKVTVYKHQCEIMEDETIWTDKLYCRKWQSVEKWNARYDDFNNED